MERGFRPLFLVTVGYPGSGKSYFAAQLASELGAAHLRADDFRDWMFGEPTYSAEESFQVFHVMNHVAEKLLSTEVSVLYDANFNHAQHREEARAKAERYGAQFVLLHVDTPPEVAFGRVEARAAHRMTKERFEELREEIEDFSGEHPVRVDGTRTYDDQKEDLLARLYA